MPHASSYTQTHTRTPTPTHPCSRTRARAPAGHVRSQARPHLCPSTLCPRTRSTTAHPRTRWRAVSVGVGPVPIQVRSTVSAGPWLSPAPGSRLSMGGLPQALGVAGDWCSPFDRVHRPWPPHYPLRTPVVGIALALRRAGAPRRAVRTSLGRAPAEAGFRASAGCGLPRLRSV